MESLRKPRETPPGIQPVVRLCRERQPEGTALDGPVLERRRHNGDLGKSGQVGACDGRQAGAGFNAAHLETTLGQGNRRFAGTNPDFQDLVQEALAKAFRRLTRYKPEGKFESWLMTIAHRVGLDYLRKKELDTVPVEDDLGGPTPEPGTNASIQLADPSPSPLRHIEIFDALWKAMGAIEALPRNVGLCYLLRTQKDMSFKEIAIFVELPEDTVRKYVSIGSTTVQEAARKALEDSQPT